MHNDLRCIIIKKIYIRKGMRKLRIKGIEIGTGMPLICVPVVERTGAEIIEEMKYLSQSAADVIEWRVDMFESFRDYNAVREILRAAEPLVREKLFLYTFRSKRQGGEAEADGSLILDLHDLAAESGCVDLVDMEYFEEEKPQKKIKSLQSQGVRVVASHHDFEGTPVPEVMKMLLEKMCAGGADIVKLAVMPKAPKDVLRLLEVTEEFHSENPDTPVITMAMGAMGGISRLCGETFGSCVTFGTHKKSSAPGQLEMDGLKQALAMIHKSNLNNL